MSISVLYVLAALLRYFLIALSGLTLLVSCVYGVKGGSIFEEWTVSCLEYGNRVKCPEKPNSLSGPCSPRASLSILYYHPSLKSSKVIYLERHFYLGAV